MKTAEQIGQDLRSLRGTRSRSQVARELGISESAIISYESGERTPRDELKVTLAAYFGVTVGSLFFGEGCHKS